METKPTPTLEEVSLELIIHGGEARGLAFDALKAAREGDFEKAGDLLKRAQDEIHSGHEAQTALLQSEGEGAKMKADLLFVHAHGHLMTAMSELGLIREMVQLYRKLSRDYLHR